MKGLSIAVCMAVIGLTAGTAAEENTDTWIGADNVAICEEVGADTNICPELLEAIIETESSGEEDARNGPCVGLMQISEKYHKARMTELGFNDLTDPEANIRTGASLLHDLFEEYEDIAVVLMKYNGTPNAEERAEEGRITRYAQKIMDRSEELERAHGK